MEMLKTLLSLLNGATIASEAFGKGRSWFSQRVNGNLVNGKPAQFTPAERAALSHYLRTKAVTLAAAADALERP